MTLRTVAGLAVVGLVLTGCGGRSAKEQTAAAYCPSPLTVQDAQRITRFKEGAGRDPRDVVFEAAMANATTRCQMGRNRLEVDVVMRIAVNAGPSVAGEVTRVPFFVRVLDAGGNVIVGKDELADYKLSARSPRGVSDETVAVTLPFGEARELGAYRIAVGLKPTAQELDYNRRSGGR
ncbi:MAG TPA: hypothetical protein VEC60_11385 [Reyranella sp.]|nr:hypothetical protein [Reyranella sp.]